MRKGALFLAAGAVLLLAAAGATRYVVLPRVYQVPSNVDTITRYSGTLSMLNPAALAAGDASKLFLTNVPVTAEQHVKAITTSGRTIVMSSDTAVKGPEGSTLLTSNHVYSLDRVNLDAAPPPAGSNAETHTGLALGFPLKPEQKDYQYWDSTTQAAVAAKYARTEPKGGRDAYVYIAHAEGGIKDPKVQAMLPASLPKTALPLFAGTLPAEVRGVLTALLPALMPVLPANIALSYTSLTDTTFWVDSATGVVLDVNQKQVIRAQMSGPLAAAPVPNVLDLTLKNTDESVKASADSAVKAQNSVMLLSTYLPAGLGALGLLLLILAIIAAARRRRPAQAETEHETEQPATS